ncbi:MAG: hypothetical protein JWM16_4348 [Verrucomicrobiales bacterium]|nr:hypothetical protein [Verrucomicrobiales bacterium]
MADDTKTFNVTTWEKTLLLRKRLNWTRAELVAFLNKKRVLPIAIKEKAYSSWENGTARAPKEAEERIDDVITMELYRTQKNKT